MWHVVHILMTTCELFGCVQFHTHTPSENETKPTENDLKQAHSLAC